jgi:chemotaxis protein methyltransferase CheR
MIDNRLQKLMREISYSGEHSDLLDLIANGKYQTEFINAFTTNKTSFFREGFHFEDLRSRVLPPLMKENRDIKIYCSASSTGEEPYSIAMTLLQTQKDNRISRANISLLSTDIDTDVLQKAREGIYMFNPHKNDIPSWVKIQSYFKRRVTDNSSSEFLIKAKDELKRIMHFDQLNLSDENYPFSDGEFDVVFCRNVLIYFTMEDQNKILKKLFRKLKMGGTLYLGHSENPLDLHAYVRRVGHNIFIKEKELL